MDISVIAGIAPGLDFNFDQLDDCQLLLQKAQQLLNDGASEILVLWDDIHDEFPPNKHSLTEGTAHAQVVNRLSGQLDRPLLTVPRVYAFEIENKNNYLGDFFSELDTRHSVLFCGNAIVMSQIDTAQVIQQTSGKHELIYWDNFYANDYCPRRLFAGPWSGRDDVDSYLLNPTGMPHTDQLLLAVAVACHNREDKKSAWRSVLVNAGVPIEFFTIAHYFDSPMFGDQLAQRPEALQINKYHSEAIEHCLWRWKGPLSREWYPYFMGLKHDLALVTDSLPVDRILKTQSAPLAQTLLAK